MTAAHNGAAPPAALQFTNIVKDYVSDGAPPVRALDGLNLTIPQGSFFGLLGPNGAGKSTLIRIATGLVRLTSGGVSTFGVDAVADPVRARSLMGLAPQEPNLDRFLTVREVLRFHGRYFGLDRRAAYAKADELIDAFDLGAKANARSTRLSGGQRRRVLLAKAFLHDPPLVILDEPTAGVDVELRMELHDYIRRFHASGRTVLLTTHYLEEAEQLCDDLALIQHGTIVARGTPQTLKSEHAVSTVEELYLQVITR